MNTRMEYCFVLYKQMKWDGFQLEFRHIKPLRFDLFWKMNHRIVNQHKMRSSIMYYTIVIFVHTLRDALTGK